MKYQFNHLNILDIDKKSIAFNYDFLICAFLFLGDVGVFLVIVWCDDQKHAQVTQHHHPSPPLTFQTYRWSFF